MKYQTENSIIVEIMRYRDLEVRMKKKISALLVMLLACGIFGGCGATKDADTTTLFPEKKGGITEVAVGDFDKDNYDENELEQYVKDSIKEYEDNDGAGTVKLKNLSVKDGVAKLGMHYSDSTAYSAFVGDTVFTGTVVQAIAAGYDFNTDFVAVTDGAAGDAADSKDVMKNDDYHVIVLSKGVDVTVDGTLQYVSSGVTVKDKNTATVEEIPAGETAEARYIIYK